MNYMCICSSFICIVYLSSFSLCWLVTPGWVKFIILSFIKLNKWISNIVIMWRYIDVTCSRRSHSLIRYVTYQIECITGVALTWPIRRLTHMKQDLLSLPAHLISPQILVLLILHSLIFFVVFCVPLLMSLWYCLLLLFGFVYDI